MKKVCESQNCTGCQACKYICPKKAIEIIDNAFSNTPQINDEKCINCKLCEKVCQNHNNIEGKYPEQWFQGWAKSKEIRSKGSSGGAATSIATGFIKNGGYVCCCSSEEEEYSFRIVKDSNDLMESSGSKYVKSNVFKAYEEIKKYIKSKKILFIGLPCQVAAMKLLFKNEKNLYTIDLICHGTPSIKMFNTFLKQLKIENINYSLITFRKKSNYSINIGKKQINKKGNPDEYMIEFMAGDIFQDNCYNCKYAKTQRISDLTLGDSLGSDLISERYNGISLILVMNDKGKELLKNSELILKPVDIEKACEKNKQLNAPFPKPKKRDKFLKMIAKGISFNTATFICHPKQVIVNKFINHKK